MCYFQELADNVNGVVGDEVYRIIGSELTSSLG